MVCCCFVVAVHVMYIYVFMLFFVVFFLDGSIMQFGLDHLENPVGTGMLFFFLIIMIMIRKHDYDYHHEPYLPGIKKNMLFFIP